MKKILSIILIVVFSIGVLSSCKNKEEELKVEDIRAICELATIKCYYNNVVEIIKERDNIFQKDRKMWIEYEGIATIGVNMSEVEIDVNKTKVTVTIPDAELFDIQPNRETFNEKSYVASSDGFFTKNKITTEEQTEVITIGQEKMKENVLNNENLFVRAKERAKELIENYIKKVAEISNKEYQIEWN